MSYIDPQNLDEELEKLTHFSTIGDIINYVNNLYPKWIVNVLKKYSDDYPIFKLNCNHILEKFNIKLVQIIIVDEIIYDDKHILIRSISEILSKAGFSIRQKYDFFPCSICNSALPSEEIYNEFKKNSIEVPASWDIKCTNC